ncbi:hypothetical protein [uncultured Endozoicomonas sp.]|uniref:hypothetical protein n=1 Tax=uncultured Endozoicomonas sp. TaxID=432652 RepID=UPI0026130A33|nr:hypothetical protein [uncultured Endozoicomonas sp.]
MANALLAKARLTEALRKQSRNAIVGGVLACLSGIALGYPDADRQGEVYPELQDVHRIAQFQGINTQDETLRWQVNEPNLIQWLLAPWDAAKVNEALFLYKEEYGSIADTAVKVASIARDHFDASGHQITEAELERLLTLVESTGYLQQFDPRARAITVMDTDAQFFPSDVFVTNNLSSGSNVAANQKSSSTLIARNTPVIVLGQLTPVSSPGLDAAEDSWVALWRPEFGLKFAKSRHIALVGDDLVNKLQSGYGDDGLSGQLKLTTTTRIKSVGEFHRLPLGVPVFYQNGEYLMAARSGIEAASQQTSAGAVRLFNAQLMPVSLATDPSGSLGDQIPNVPMLLNYKNYLNQISNVLLKYPAGYVALAENENRYFAFGEGTVGPDSERGMDASTFALKVVQPFGKWLPRYSVHQVQEGVENRLLITTNQGDSEENFQAMLNHCSVGNFASVGAGNNMACLGSVTLEQLGQISPQAKADALATGGMTESDRVPLVALSAVGLTHREGDGVIWYITGKAAIFPVFKSGYLSSFVRDGRSLSIFSYFQLAP